MLSVRPQAEKFYLIKLFLGPSPALFLYVKARVLQEVWDTVFLPLQTQTLFQLFACSVVRPQTEKFYLIK
jgi:hypothetical protein